MIASRHFTSRVRFLVRIARRSGSIVRRGAMKKPAGVMIIAITDILAAAFGAIIGTRPMLALIRQQVQPSGASSGWAEIGAVLVLTGFFFPILYLVSGWGLWKLKNWGRFLTIMLAGIAAAFQLVRWLLSSHLIIETVFSPSLFA